VIWTHRKVLIRKLFSINGFSPCDVNALDGVEDEIVVGLSYNNETKYLVDSQTSAISPSEISSLQVIE
jgi:hypothetical protein